MKEITKQRIVIFISAFLPVIAFEFWGDKITMLSVPARIAIYVIYGLVVAGAVQRIGRKS